MRKLSLVIIFLFSFKSYSQTNNEPELLGYSISRDLGCRNIFSSNDCVTPITIKAYGKYYFKCAPKGIGQNLEFNKNLLGNLHYIEKEHNTVWVKFRITKSGTFAFKLLPDDIDIDLDFMLFEKKSDNYCDDIINKKNKPIRTNISRPDKSNYSSTGLSVLADNDYYSSGKGKAYSNSLKVNKGDEYILVIDKVNERGDGGFHLQFQYFDYTIISGTIVDEESNKPIESIIMWEDASTGEVLSKAKSNSATGEYEMKVPFEPYNLTAPYILTTEKKGYFYAEKTVTTHEIKSQGQALSLVLPKLKKSMFGRIKSINFIGNEAEVIPTSIASVKRLNKLMIKNPSLKIRIDGHVNGCDDHPTWTQRLSEDRATTIWHHLTTNGINRNRITKKGFGCTKMLYPLPENEEENKLNRRVEILVLDY
jgi:outer membrane protein OmpA-like peptidoglycan-associated protein